MALINVPHYLSENELPQQAVVEGRQLANLPFPRSGANLLLPKSS
jgi:hypothetical protein